MRKRKLIKQPTLFIVVNPIASKFAKAIQTALRGKVTDRILRVGRSRDGKRNFFVTPRTLNKIEQLTRFHAEGVSAPAFTTDSNRLNTLGSKVIFARRLVNSTGGKGIVEFNTDEQRDIPVAPLYTAYVPKKAEYRVHVFGQSVIDIQQKRKKRGFEDERDTRVRNLSNGYVYCRDNLNHPDGIGDLAVRAVEALDYQYGAVDIVYNEKRNQCYVLEVNSRPGLMGTTVDKYADALINLFNLRRN